MNAHSVTLTIRRLPRRRPEKPATALGPAIQIIRDLDKLPSCFLAQLLDTPFQVLPVAAVHGTIELSLQPNGWLALHSTPAKATKTIFIGDILAALPLPEGCAGLVIDPGTPLEFRLPTQQISQLQEIQAAVAILSNDDDPSESEEIPSGTEMTIATPLPEPGPEFTSLLSRELASRRDLKAAYLFDLIQENDENRLTIGLVPRSKTDPDFQTFPDRLLETLSTHLPGVGELDLLILEEPELIEIVASTVPSLLAKKSA